LSGRSTWTTSPTLKPSRPLAASPAATSASWHRLFTQIERTLKINGLTVITNDVIEAARSRLVIGAE